MKKIIISLFIIFIIIILIEGIINIHTTKAESITLASTVISKWQTNGSPTSWNANDSGIFKTNGLEYRYVGANVDNWVKFNNDYYRIIGVFDSNSHGITGQNLVKLIKDKELVSTAWGVYNDTTNYTTYAGYNNNWTGEATAGNESEVNNIPASANVLLNTYFFNPSGTSTYGTCENLSYYYNSDDYKTKDCSRIKRYGIQSQELRNYIEDVTWYLYGYTGVGLNKDNWYQCERNNYTNCTSANSGKYKGTTTEKIGLMYVSDFMYASSYYASSDTTIMSNTSNFVFANQNWIYNGQEWTITPRIDNATSLFTINPSGYVQDIDASVGLGLRPVFYLKSQVYVTGGNGSFSNPYTIACDNCS